jgi:hypothetical protein
MLVAECGTPGEPPYVYWDVKMSIHDEVGQTEWGALWPFFWRCYHPPGGASHSIKVASPA